MDDFSREDIVSFDALPREDGTPMAFTVRLKDGTFRTVTVEQLDAEGREFFGI